MLNQHMERVACQTCQHFHHRAPVRQRRLREDLRLEEIHQTAIKSSGVPFSGEHGFAETIMYWPINHMMVPQEQALGCLDCHGDASGLEGPGVPDARETSQPHVAARQAARGTSQWGCHTQVGSPISRSLPPGDRHYPSSCVRCPRVATALHNATVMQHCAPAPDTGHPRTPPLCHRLHLQRHRRGTIRRHFAELHVKCPLLHVFLNFTHPRNGWHTACKFAQD